MRHAHVEPMNVSAIIVTRGNVDLDPCWETMPDEWEKIEWNNGEEAVYGHPPPSWYRNASDLSVYGRYAAIEYAAGDVIYVQDDDVIVSDPAAIVNALIANYGAVVSSPLALAPGAPLPDVTHVQIEKNLVVCNMPAEFRHDFYTDNALVGFGAAFHRDTPARAFDRWWNHDFPSMAGEDGYFNRTCDIVLTGLSPCVLVDVPKTNLDHATADDRMYRQPNHVRERSRIRELVAQVRMAG